MAIDLNNYVEKVFQRIAKGKPSATVGHYRSAVESTVDAALKIMADAVADSPDPVKRALLQKDFSYTLSGGEAVLSTNPSLITNTIPSVGYVTLAGVTQPLQWLPFRLDLDFPPPISEYTYYTIIDNKIVVRSSSGAIPSGTALTVHANYIPTLAEVPDELTDDDLVTIGLQIAMGLDAQPPLAQPQRPRPEDES